MFGFQSTKFILDIHGRVTVFLQGTVQTSPLSEYYLAAVTHLEPGARLSLDRNKWTGHQ